MPTILKTKNSVTTTVVPTTLQQGELAVNITDKKMWVGNAATTPVQLFGAGADTTFTNISVSGVATFGAGTVSLPAITTTGDTNTGIFFPAADTIAFTEGGAESMRVNSSGQVGVGTTSPSTWSGSNLVSYFDGGNNFAGITAINGNTGTGIGGIQFGSDTTYTKAAIGLLRQSANGRGRLVFYNDSNADAANWSTADEKMCIDEAGNVGINITNPSTKLHVVGVITATQGVTGTPVFSCFPALDTTISSSTQTVIANNTEEYDLGGCYNNTGSTVTLNGISVPAYSFAPNVAGYYSFNMTANTELSVAPIRCFVMIVKNGSAARVSENQTAAIGVFGGPIIYYLNGTGDYVNAQIWLAATTPTYSGGFASTRFQGTLIRAA
jgi:hypothetical protein